MAQPQPSLRDIARRLNVSHVTVSMALRGHPRISAARREQVRRMSEELGYRPDPMLASLIAYRRRKQVRPVTSTLAWINRWDVPEALRQRREFDAYWQGAREAAEQMGYRVEEFRLTADMPASRLNTILLTRSVAGLLIPPHPPGAAWIDNGLDWQRFAIVRFGFSILDLRVHMIGNDQMRSAELAVRRMAELGYRRIGYISNAQFDLTTDGNFRMGYVRGGEATAARAKLKPLLFDELLRTDDATASRRLAAWLTEHRPDAILTSEPALRPTLEKLGRRVPTDIALAATTVRDGGGVDAGIDQNPVEIGRVAVHTLIELINRQERGMPEYCRRVLVESRWVDGASLPARAA